MSERVLFTNFRWGLTGEPQSMMLENGKVIYRGPLFESKAILPTVDLRGRFLLPPLIESHCHIVNTGLFMAMLNLGNAHSREEILDILRDASRDRPEGWLLAIQYDQNRWGGLHITRAQLDAISSEQPILLRHVNGHAGIANSAALQAAGISDFEPDPPGGSYGRDADGRLDGLLLENGFLRVSESIPKMNLASMVEAILAAGRSMHAYGIGCAHDMMTGFFDLDLELEAYELAAERGNPVDIRLYVQWADAIGRGARQHERLKDLKDRDRSSGRPVVAGVKIFADGAIGSGTAAIYGSYESDPNQTAKVSGQLMYPPERLTTMVREAHNTGWPIAIHAIGDYATDLVLNAYEATSDPSRHRLEHAMMLSDAQIEHIQRLGISVSMQPEFLYRFGHTYQAQLGNARASQLNRARSLVERGVPLALNSDRPIVSGDPWLGMATAVNRPDIFDPSENLTPDQALAGYLTQSALIGGDSPLVANLEEGADGKAIVLSRDPREPGVATQDVAWLDDFLPHV